MTASPADRPRIRPADYKVEPTFKPGARAVLVLVLFWTLPAAVLWAGGQRIAEASTQWIMTIAALIGVGLWALKGAKFRLTPDMVVIRRLGKIAMHRWETLSELRRVSGTPLLGPRWIVLTRDGREAATFTRWTADADHLAALIGHAIGERKS